MSRFSKLELDARGEPNPLDRELAPVRDDDRDERHWLALALRHWQGGRFEKALRYYSRALEYDPNLHAGWVGQARMLIERGELAEAVLWADKALDLHRDHPELLAARAIAVLRQGDAEKALAFVDLALKKAGASPFAWLARGEVLLAHRCHDNADHCFGKAHAESRGDWFVATLAARACVDQGDPSRALVWAKRAVEKDPTQAFAWAIQGDALFGLGLAGAADLSYRRALAIDRESAQGREGLERLARQGIARRLWTRLKGLFVGGAT